MIYYIMLNKHRTFTGDYRTQLVSSNIIPAIPPPQHILAFNTNLRASQTFSLWFMGILNHYIHTEESYMDHPKYAPCLRDRQQLRPDIDEVKTFQGSLALKLAEIILIVNGYVKDNIY